MRSTAEGEHDALDYMNARPGDGGQSLYCTECDGDVAFLPYESSVTLADVHDATRLHFKARGHRDYKKLPGGFYFIRP